MGPSSHRTFLQGLSESERKVLLAHAETSAEGGGSNRSSSVSYSGQSDIEQAKQLILNERERRRQLEVQVSSLQTALKDQASQLEEVRNDRDGLRQNLQRHGERGTRLAGQLASLEQENTALSAKLLAASNERAQLTSKLEAQQMRITELQQGYVSLASSCSDEGLERRDLLRRSKLGGLLRDAAAAGVLDAELQQQLGALDRPATYKSAGGAIAALTRERDALQQRVHELSSRLAEAVGREGAARGAQALRSAAWKRSAVQAEARLTAALRRVKELSEELRKRDGEARQRDKYTAQLERTVMAQHRSLQQQRRMLEAGGAASAASARCERVPGVDLRAAGDPAEGDSGPPAAAAAAVSGAVPFYSAREAYSGPLGPATSAAAAAAPAAGALGYGLGARFAWDEMRLADLVCYGPGHEAALRPNLGREARGVVGGGGEPPLAQRLGQGQEVQHQQHSGQQQQDVRPSGAWRGAQVDGWSAADLPATARDGDSATAAAAEAVGAAAAAAAVAVGAAGVVAPEDGARDWLPPPFASVPGRRQGVPGRPEFGGQGLPAADGGTGDGAIYLLGGAARGGTDGQAAQGRSSSPPPAVVFQQLSSVEASLAQLYRELEEFKDYSQLGRAQQHDQSRDRDPDHDDHHEAGRQVGRDPQHQSRDREERDRHHDDVDDNDDGYDEEEGVGGGGGRGSEANGRGSGGGGGGGSPRGSSLPSSPTLYGQLGGPFSPDRDIHRRRRRGGDDPHGPPGAWRSRPLSDGEGDEGRSQGEGDDYSDPGPCPGSASFAFPPSPTLRPPWSPAGSPGRRLVRSRSRAREQQQQPQQQQRDVGRRSRRRSPAASPGGSQCSADGNFHMKGRDGCGGGSSSEPVRSSHRSLRPDTAVCGPSGVVGAAAAASGGPGTAAAPPPPSSRADWQGPRSCTSSGGGARRSAMGSEAGELYGGAAVQQQQQQRRSSSTAASRTESLHGGSVGGAPRVQANMHAPPPPLGSTRPGSGASTRAPSSARQSAAGDREGGAGEEDGNGGDGMPTFSRWSCGATKADGVRGTGSSGSDSRCHHSDGRGGEAAARSRGGGSAELNDQRGGGGGDDNARGGSVRSLEQQGSGSGGGGPSHSAGASDRSGAAGSQQSGLFRTSSAGGGGTSSASAATGGGILAGVPWDQAGCDEATAEERPRQPLPTHMLGHILRCSHYGSKKLSPQRGPSCCKAAGAAAVGGGAAAAAAAARSRTGAAHRMQPCVRLGAGSPPSQGPAAGGGGGGGLSSERSGPGGASPAVPPSSRTDGGPRGGVRAAAGRGSYTEQHNLRLSASTNAGASAGQQRSSPAGRKLSSRSRSPVGGCSKSPVSGRNTPVGVASARDWERRSGGRLTSPDRVPPARSSGHHSTRHDRPTTPTRAPPEPTHGPDARLGPGYETQLQPHPALLVPSSPEALSPISTLLANLAASPPGPSRSVAMPGPRTAAVAAANTTTTLDRDRDDVSGCVDQRQHQDQQPGRARDGDGGGGGGNADAGTPRARGQQGEGKEAAAAAATVAASAMGRPGAKRRPHDDTADGADDRRKTRGASCGAGERSSNGSNGGACTTSASGGSSSGGSSSSAAGTGRGWVVTGPALYDKSGTAPAVPFDDHHEDDDGDVGLWRPLTSGRQRGADTGLSRSVLPLVYSRFDADDDRDNKPCREAGVSMAPGAAGGGSGSKGSCARPTLAGWLADPTVSSSSRAYGASTPESAGSRPRVRAGGSRCSSDSTQQVPPQTPSTSASGEGPSAAATALQRLRDKRLQRVNQPQPPQQTAGLLRSDSGTSGFGSEFGSGGMEEVVPRRRHYPAPSAGCSEDALRRACSGVGGGVVLTLRGSLHGEVVVSPRVVTPRADPGSPFSAGAAEEGGRDEGPMLGDGGGGSTVRLEVDSSGKVAVSGGGGGARPSSQRSQQPETAWQQEQHQERRQQSWQAAEQCWASQIWEDGAQGQQPRAAVGLGLGPVKEADCYGQVSSGGNQALNERAPYASSFGVGDRHDRHVARAGPQGVGEPTAYDAASKGDEDSELAQAALPPGPHPLMQLLGQASEDLLLLSNRLKPLVGTGT